MVLTAWGSGPKNRGMTWPEWSPERLIVSFAGISSDQPRSQGRAFGARGDHAAGPLRSKSCFSGFEVSRA
jgi:hypothetical protein